MSDLMPSSRRTTSGAPCPTSSNETVARALGAAFVQTLRAGGEQADRDRGGARHARLRRRAWPPRSPRGARAEGVDVVDAGLGSTDMLYFASGALDLPGAMFTASHNPAQYNGSRCAGPARSRSGRTPGWPRSATAPRRSSTAGRRSASRPARSRQRDLLAEYAAHLRTLVDLSADPAAQGRGRRGQRHGRATPCRRCSATRSCRALPLTIVPLYFELDGSFPNHEANPLEPANLVDLQTAVASTAPTSGSPSTATPTAASWSTTDGDPVSPARSPRWSRRASWPSTRAARSSTT